MAFVIYAMLASGCLAMLPKNSGATQTLQGFKPTNTKEQIQELNIMTHSASKTHLRIKRIFFFTFTIC